MNPIRQCSPTAGVDVKSSRECSSPETAREQDAVDLRQRLIAQFGRPTGFWGRVAGLVMAHRPSNRKRNAWTVSRLNIQVADRVLEIGFGPGLAIEEISKIALHGYVVGLDHSEVMLRQARKRNAAAIHEGRVKLQLGSVASLPAFDQPFDKVLAVNAIQFWPNPVDCLKQLRAVMRRGALIALTYQPRHPGATDGDAQKAGEEIVTSLRRAGFGQVGLEIYRMKPVSAVCAVGVS